MWASLVTAWRALRTFLGLLPKILAFLGLSFVAGTLLQVSALRVLDPAYTWTMVDRLEGQLLEGKTLGLDWKPRRIEGLGKTIGDMAVVSEDARFWHHGGFDWKGICDALRHNADGGHLRGGSTIDQQVARNVFLWQERSWTRKGLEAWYTFWMSNTLSKERILELYLNVAETGIDTFGVEAGAKRYFKKRARDLSPIEAAGLISIFPSPRRWSPTTGPAAKRARLTASKSTARPGSKGFAASAKSFAKDGSPWSACRPLFQPEIPKLKLP